MQLLGHLALGYFSGTLVSRYTKERIFLPVIWVCSLLPDLDFLAHRLLMHRGPTHSIVLAAALFLPVYLIARRGLPYFAALASHTLIGDYLNPSEMLFWPISNEWFGATGALQLSGTTLMIVEVSLFALMAVVMIFRYNRSRRELGLFRK